MASFTGLVTVGLAVVLGTAALGKSRNVVAGRATASDLGIPAAIGRQVVVVVIGCELAAAALLVAPGTRRIGAGVAIALLVAFTALMGVALARGARPSCACFGQRHPTPIGRATLARNAVLLSLAVVAELPTSGSIRVPTSRAELTAGLIAVTVILVVFVAAATWSIVNLMRQQGRLLLRLELLEREGAHAANGAPLVTALPGPRRAPDFELPDASGQRFALSQLRRPERDLLIMFSDEDCATCRDLLPRLFAADRDDALGVGVAVISRQASRDGVLVDADGAVAREYGVAGVPSAVLVDPDGMMHHEVAAGPVAISALLQTRRVATAEAGVNDLDLDRAPTDPFSPPASAVPA